MPGDYEVITLVGGPVDGEQRYFDGGDYFQVTEKPPFAVFEGKSRLYYTRHTYRRDSEQRDRFEYIGAT